ncbi:hypothetical protein BGZ83_007919 [Gryganskiella cystojenkinii]|nr:hypothetical protein BGZ83_007919 [Gryganskiella cystojenkinii]
MFIKSIVAASLALVATVSAQSASSSAPTTGPTTAPPATGNYIQFTAPVLNTTTYTAGQTATFSWRYTCVAPNTHISPNPTKTEVQLMDSTDSNASSFLAIIATIDCSTATQGNPTWTVPADADPNKKYSLTINTQPQSYSSTFKILPAGGATPSGSSTGTPAPKPTSGASVVAPALAGAAALGSAALLLL